MYKPTQVIAAVLLSRKILRNLILLIAMSILLYLPFTQVWADTLFIVFPGFDFNVNVRAQTSGAAVCGSLDWDGVTLRFIHLNAWIDGNCPNSDVYNEVRVGGFVGFEDKLRGNGRSLVANNNMMLGRLMNQQPCNGTYSEQFLSMPSACSAISFLDWFDGYYGGSVPYWYPDLGGGGCTYCAYNWMIDAQCSGPTDTHCSIFMMQ